MSKSRAIRMLQDWLYRELPIYEHTKATVEELGSTVRCRIPLNENNKNHFGAVHAALQFAVCEMAGGLAINQCSAIQGGDFLLVVRDLNIEYLKPAMTDIEAVAKISEQQLSEIDSALRDDGKMELELGIELFDTEGTVVARATGSYYASRKKQPDFQY